LQACVVLWTSRSGYYAWRSRSQASTHQIEGLVLAAHVQCVHIASREAYGARKAWKALIAEDVAWGHIAWTGSGASKASKAPLAPIQGTHYVWRNQMASQEH